MPNDFNENHGQFFFAEVRDIDDPLKSGRHQIRHYGKNDDEGNVTDDNLRWGMPMQGVTSAATGKVGSSPTGMRKGSRVMVTYAHDDPEKQYPIIMGSYARGAPGNGDPTGGKDSLDQNNYGVDIPGTAHGSGNGQGGQGKAATSPQGRAYNKKLDEFPFELGRTVGRYPYINVTMDDTGRQHMTYADPKDPGINRRILST